MLQSKIAHCQANHTTREFEVVLQSNTRGIYGSKTMLYCEDCNWQHTLSTKEDETMEISHNPAQEAAATYWRQVNEECRLILANLSLAEYEAYLREAHDAMLEVWDEDHWWSRGMVWANYPATERSVQKHLEAQYLHMLEA